MDRIGEGYLVSEASQIQAQVSLPVIGVGGIQTVRYINESLGLNRFSLAAIGRAILTDPLNWSHQGSVSGIESTGLKALI